MKVEIKTFPPQNRTIIYMKKPYFIYLPKLVFIQCRNYYYHDNTYYDTYLFYEYQNYLYSFAYIFPNIYSTSRVCDKIFNINGNYTVNVIDTFWTTSFTNSLGPINNILQTPNWWETYKTNKCSLQLLINEVGFCKITKFVISKTKYAEEKLNNILNEIQNSKESEIVIENIMRESNQLLDYYRGLKNES